MAHEEQTKHDPFLWFNEFNVYCVSVTLSLTPPFIFLLFCSCHHHHVPHLISIYYFSLDNLKRFCVSYSCDTISGFHFLQCLPYFPYSIWFLCGPQSEDSFAVFLLADPMFIYLLLEFSLSPMMFFVHCIMSLPCCVSQSLCVKGDKNNFAWNAKWYLRFTRDNFFELYCYLPFLLESLCHSPSPCRGIKNEVRGIEKKDET